MPPGQGWVEHGLATPGFYRPGCTQAGKVIEMRSSRARTSTLGDSRRVWMTASLLKVGIVATFLLALLRGASGVPISPPIELQIVAPRLVLAVTNTTSVPDTTPPPEAECPSPPDGPCPVNQHIFLQPQNGPNRNYQQMGQIVTVSGVFFPEDCSKGCLFSPPCETCEMEVTYFIYFGSADAGCNFEDTAASACQCTPLSGQVIISLPCTLLLGSQLQAPLAPTSACR